MLIRYRSNGFTLLEILLILTIVVIFIVLIINRYQKYYQQITIAEINSDITIIYQALNRYFYVIGCQKNGSFPKDKINPTISDLGLPLSYQNRNPLIIEYKAHIVDSQQLRNKKPIYFLEIDAKFDQSIPVNTLNWYKKVFDATEVNTQLHTLTWKTRPNIMVKYKKQFWILNGAIEIFRKSENTGSIGNYNYCAE